jgi:hypothetical protein
MPERVHRLIRTLEGEILPRLLVSLEASLASGRDGEFDEAAEFVRLLLAREECDAEQLIDGLTRLESLLREVGARAP